MKYHPVTKACESSGSNSHIGYTNRRLRALNGFASASRSNNTTLSGFILNNHRTILVPYTDGSSPRKPTLLFVL